MSQECEGSFQPRALGQLWPPGSSGEAGFCSGLSHSLWPLQLSTGACLHLRRSPEKGMAPGVLLPCVPLLWACGD